NQAKAFDRIEHEYEYLRLVLRKMNFELQIIKIIINLFNSQEAHIIKDAEFSESFRVSRGVGQGDPLSPLLYVLAFEPLLKRLERDIQ
ncbi:9488_t:CDS:1, partial [Gigaspora rosea]